MFNLTTVGIYIVALHGKHGALDHDSAVDRLAVGVMQLSRLPGGYVAGCPVRGTNRTRPTVVKCGCESNGGGVVEVAGWTVTGECAARRERQKKR